MNVLLKSCTKKFIAVHQRSYAQYCSFEPNFDEFVPAWCHRATMAKIFNFQCNSVLIRSRIIHHLIYF